MINKTKVLIVEDNTELAENLYEFLGEEEYELDLAQGGMTALHLLDTQVYDVVVLDVMIPGLSGFEICRRLRKDMNNQTPIIFMTAKGTIEDKEEGYLSGGDDYLVKPFPLRELALRINALHRRRHHDAQPLRAKSLRFNPGNLEVRLNGGQAIALSGLAAHIFEALIRSYPDFVSYDSLSSRLWPGRDVDANTLRTHIYMLRKQLQDAYGHSLIKTLHGRGYILTPPDPDQAES
ncbi:response regulator transcription factor [Halotalea alkalilenta]|uniref:response regulator transcription factor n=1 Tax=Halotalea alkalilenta TaxID=376489 RepID=UPI0005BB4A47|nr:response regulator transcription factor [Halotalea alkalilenta]